MFAEFDALQETYRDEANQWLQSVNLPEKFDDLPYKDKIHFVVSDVQNLTGLSENEKVQRAYYRSCLVLGSTVKDIETGNFSKPLMRYFLNDRKPRLTREESNQRSSVMSLVERVVLGHQFTRETNYIHNFANILDKPVPVLDDIFDKFLKAGELKELTEVVLYVAQGADGQKSGDIREFVVNDIVASLMSRLDDRSDLDGADLAMLIEQSDLTPKALHESDFYLDHVVPQIDDRIRETAARRVGMIADDSVLWDIKDHLSDREIFNYLLPRAEKTKTMDNWVVSMAEFELLTGKALTIREALGLNPQYGFNLASTKAYQDRLDEVGTERIPESFRAMALAWEDEGLDEDDDVYRISVTLESAAFLIDQVSERIDRGTMAIPEIRGTTTGADFVTYEMEFESQADMLARRKDIRIELTRLFMDSIKDVPLPGDSIQMVIPEGYDEEDVNTETFKVGDTGVVSAVGYFGGNSPAYKIKGVYGYQDPEHLVVTERPKFLRKHPEKEPEPQ